VVVLLYVLFFLSGAAALVYEVVWARSLALVFGGSHLAVATVLSVFMGGLRLGGWLLGRAADRSRRPLRLYALLELGIAAPPSSSSCSCAPTPSSTRRWRGFCETSPVMAHAPAGALRGGGDAPSHDLMGGTLPVLSRLIARARRLGRAPPLLLYGINTLGAVTGALWRRASCCSRTGSCGGDGGGHGHQRLRGPFRLAPVGEADRTRAVARARNGPLQPACRSSLPARPSGHRHQRLLRARLRGPVDARAEHGVRHLRVHLHDHARGLPGRDRRGWPGAHACWRGARGWRLPVLAFAATQAAIGICAPRRLLRPGAAPRARQRAADAPGCGPGRVPGPAGQHLPARLRLHGGPAFFMGLAFPWQARSTRVGRGHAGAAVGEVLAREHGGSHPGRGRRGLPSSSVSSGSSVPSSSWWW
jgi:hypothetical protein